LRLASTGRSLGTYIRTLAALTPRQVLERPLYRLRRSLAPGLMLSLSPLLSTRADASRLDALSRCPPPSPMSDPALAQLRLGVLELSGHAAPLPLPGAAPPEPACHDPLYRYDFHGLGWLRGALASPACDGPLRDQLLDWLGRYLAHPPPLSSVFWDPYPLATRIMSCQALSGEGLRLPESLGRCVAQWTLVLSALSERHLMANHLLRNHAGVVVGSQALGGRVGRRISSRAMAQLVGEARRQFLADGCHEERTPGYHLLATMDVLAGVACADEGSDYRRRLAGVAESALGALAVLTHEDGRLSAFGDTAPGSLPTPESVEVWAASLRVRPRPGIERGSGAWRRRTLTAAGFSRLQGAGLSVILSHGPFGAPHNPGHAHCDLFSFELDALGTRVVCDPGVHSYHDPVWRERTRAAASHATPSIRGREQAEIWKAFRCGWRPSTLKTDWQQDGGDCRFLGEALAFGPREPLGLRRELVFQAGRVKVKDRIAGAPEFSVALTLGPSVQAARAEETCVVLPIPGGAVRLVVDHGRVERSQGYLSQRFGDRRPAQVLTLHADPARGLAFSLELVR
jgi:uncharacterized heparinase superfamily protein